MSSRFKNWFVLSIADVLFISVLFYLALHPVTELLSDGDTGYHIRAGEFILNNFSIPKVDIFSFITPVIPWTAHEWLSEVIMAILHQLGGLTAVVVAFSILIALSVRLFFKSVKTDGNNILLSIAAAIAFVALAKVHWLARPHIFSLVLLIMWCQLLDDFQYRHQNRLWLLPLIMLLWVNLHGGFIIALLILSIYFAGNCALIYTDSSQWAVTGKNNTYELGKIVCASYLACLLNPVGYKIFFFPFNLISNKFIMDHTTEFLSPNFHDLQPFKYLLLLLIIILACAKKTPNLIEITLTILLTSMSLYSVRYIPLFAVVVIPIMLRYTEVGSISALKEIVRFVRQRINNIESIDNQAKGYLWSILSTIVLVFLTANGSGAHYFNPEKKPIAALNFLLENPVPGNMFNNDEFGDLLIYTSPQRYKVFIDGRGDMYGSARLKEYCKVIGFEPGWESVIEKYKITWVFFDTNSVLVRFLRIDKDWKLIYSDKVASIFVKNIPMYQPLINKFPDVELFTSTTGEANEKL